MVRVPIGFLGRVWVRVEGGVGGLDFPMENEGGWGGVGWGTGKGTGKSMRTHLSKLPFSKLPFSFSPTSGRVWQDRCDRVFFGRVGDGGNATPM